MRSLWKAVKPGVALRIAAAILAVAGQIGMSGASLTLARAESSTVSHTEQSGVDLHQGHNEATCAVCIALSLQGTPGLASAPLNTASISSDEPLRHATVFVADCQLLPNSCRAPPRES